MNHRPSPPLALHRPLRKMTGVTLVELMIAMTLGLAAVSVIGYAYIASKQAFRIQNALSQMQENARFIFETIGYDLRQTGSPGCAFDQAKSANALPVATQALWYGNPFSTSVPSSGVQLIAYDDAKTHADTPTTDYLKAGIIGGDGLAIVGADVLHEYLTTANTSAADTFSLTSASTTKHGTLINNRPIVARDCQSQLTLVSQTNADNSVPGTGATATFLANSRIFPLDASFYHLRTNTNGEPALFRQRLGVGTAVAGLATTCLPPVSPNTGSVCTYPEELVEGVQDMQLTFGVDTSPTADGTVDGYGTAAGVSAGSVTAPDGSTSLAIPGAIAADFWARVISVRIDLLMVSRSGESITTQPQAYTFNGATTTPTDRRLRKTFSTTLAIRNRIP